jgi:hypothetical protein
MKAYDRIKETTTTTGTGDITLAGAAAGGFFTFTSVFPVPDTFGYVIDHGSGGVEVGIGHLSGSTTLVRDRVVASTNAGALVSFGAGTKQVFCTVPAEYVSRFDTRGRTVADMNSSFQRFWKQAPRFTHGDSMACPQAPL